MDGMREIAFEAFGVALEVVHPPAMTAAIEAILPPAWTVPGADRSVGRLTVERLGDGGLRASIDGQEIVEAPHEDLVVGMLDAEIRAQIALHAPMHIFVHAGVVRIDGRAILLPGRSFTGKTTLTAALVRAGAVYYSDEFAPLDATGLVHPYPKPLSVRGEGYRQRDQPIASIGGEVGREPAVVGAICVAAFRPGGAWRPEVLSPGQAALALLENTVPARTRPEQSLTALQQAARGASAWRTERGDADQAAAALLEMLG